MESVDDIFNGNLDTLERIISSKERVSEMLKDMQVEVDAQKESGSNG